MAIVYGTVEQVKAMRLELTNIGDVTHFTVIHKDGDTFKFPARGCFSEMKPGMDVRKWVLENSAALKLMVAANGVGIEDVYCEGIRIYDIIKEKPPQVVTPEDCTNEITLVQGQTFKWYQSENCDVWVYYMCSISNKMELRRIATNIRERWDWLQVRNAFILAGLSDDWAVAESRRIRKARYESEQQALRERENIITEIVQEEVELARDTAFYPKGKITAHEMIDGEHIQIQYINGEKFIWGETGERLKPGYTTSRHVLTKEYKWAKLERKMAQGAYGVIAEVLKLKIPVYFLGMGATKKKPLTFSTESRNDPWLFRTMLKHTSEELDDGTEDLPFLKFITLLLQVEKKLMDEYKNERKIFTSMLKPGWSGVILYRDQVIDHYNVHWNQDGWCVVQGRNADGKIMNALIPSDQSRVVEFYSSTYRVSRHGKTVLTPGTKDGNDEFLMKRILAEVRLGRTGQLGKLQMEPWRKALFTWIKNSYALSFNTIDDYLDNIKRVAKVKNLKHNYSNFNSGGSNEDLWEQFCSMETVDWSPGVTNRPVWQTMKVGSFSNYNISLADEPDLWWEDDFCYLWIIWSIVWHVETECGPSFVVRIKQIIQRLGRKPQLKYVVAQLYNLSLEFEGVGTAPLPRIWNVGDGKKFFEYHATPNCAIFGENWRCLNQVYVQDMIDLVKTNKDFAEARIGTGYTERCLRLLKTAWDPRKFAQQANQDPEVLIRLMTTPSFGKNYLKLPLSVRDRYEREMLEQSKPIWECLAVIKALELPMTAAMTLEVVTDYAAHIANSMHGLVIEEDLKDVLAARVVSLDLTKEEVRQLGPLKFPSVRAQMEKKLNDSVEEAFLDGFVGFAPYRIRLSNFKRSVYSVGRCIKKNANGCMAMSVGFGAMTGVHLGSLMTSGAVSYIGAGITMCAKVLMLGGMATYARRMSITPYIGGAIFAVVVAFVWLLKMLIGASGRKLVVNNNVIVGRQVATDWAMIQRNKDSDRNGEPAEMIAHAQSATNGFMRFGALAVLVAMLWDYTQADAMFSVLSKLSTLGKIFTTRDTAYAQAGGDDEEEEDTFDLIGTSNQIVELMLKPVMPRQIGFNAKRTFYEDHMENMTIGNVMKMKTDGAVHLKATKETMNEVARKIICSDEKKFILVGRVGCGKSTNLPHQLAKDGKVLVIENSRSLTLNVTKNLEEDFGESVMCRMGGHTKPGHGNIEVQTAGYFYHVCMNSEVYKEFKYIVIDESHLLTTDMLVVRSLLQSRYNGKTIECSATPHGAKHDFEPSYMVDVRNVGSLSIEDFITTIGTGARNDPTDGGKKPKVLVYVSSYNEVDRVVQRLLAKHISCVGVDGRRDVSDYTLSFPGNMGISVIVATNIIENGITIDADAVLDFGSRVSPRVDYDQRQITMSKQSISKAERIQRIGRVGRKREGTAVTVGATRGMDYEVSEAALTEAAIICFGLGLPPPVDGVEVDFWKDVTKDQVRAAMNYELPLLYTLQLFNGNGETTEGLFRAMKSSMRHTMMQKLDEGSLSAEHYGRWRTLRSYVDDGTFDEKEFLIHVEAEELKRLRVPFGTRNVSAGMHVAIAKAAIENFKELRLKVTHKQKQQLAVLCENGDLSTEAVLQYLRARAQEFRERINMSREVPIGGTSGWLSNLIPNAAVKLRDRYYNDMKSNLRVITEAIAKVEMGHHSLYAAAEDRNAFLKDNPHMSLYAIIQSGNTEREVHDEIDEALGIQGTYKWKNVTKDLVFVAGVGVLLGVYLYTTCGKKKVDCRVEGKGNKHRRIGQKNKEWDLLQGIETPIGEEEFRMKKHKYEERAKEEAPRARRARTFNVFYGGDVADAERFRVLHPITGEIVMTGDFDQFDADEAWTRVSQAMATYYKEKDMPVPIVGVGNLKMEVVLFKENMKTGVKRVLTPHKSSMVGKQGTRAGFEGFEGEWRQTGKGEMVVLSQGKQKVIKIPEVTKVRTTPDWEDLEEPDEAYMEAKSLFKGNLKTSSIQNNLVKVTYGTKYVNGLLYGRLLIVPIHVSMEGPGNAFKIQTRNRGTIVVSLEKGVRFKQIHPCDIAVIELPFETPPFSKAISFRAPRKGETVRILSSSYSKTSNYTDYVSSESTTRPLYGTLWEYYISTIDGMCGAAVQAISDGMVVGFHSAGIEARNINAYTGITDSFLRAISDVDMLDGVCWEFSRDFIDWGPLHIANWQPVTIPKHKLVQESVANAQGGWVVDNIENGMLQEVAHMDGRILNKHVVKGRCPYLEKFLKLNPNEQMMDLMGKYGPSVLNQRAYRKDVLKYDKALVVGTVDHECFERSIFHVKTVLQRGGVINESDPCRFTWDPEEVFARIQKDTAMGAQYEGKKSQLFELTKEEREVIFIASLIKLYNGEAGIWKTSLKAELRPIEKLVEEKTRTFTAAPLEGVLAGKVCVDEFNERFYDAHLKIPSTVAINKFNGGWNKFLQALPTGWVYVCADGSRFDSSITPLLFNAVLRLRLDAQEDDEVGEVMLRNLYTQIVYTPMSLADGNVVKKMRGNNSGQPSTVVDNTLCVMIAVYYALYRAGMNGDEIEECVVFFANGDDLTMAVRPDKERVVDTMDKFFRELSLDYIFEERTTERSEVEYMSLKGIMHDGMFIPKLARERIMAIVEWERDTTTLGRHSALQAARIESFGYDDLSNFLDEFQQFLLYTDFYDDLDQEDARKISFPSWEVIRNLYIQEVDTAVVQAGDDPPDPLLTNVRDPKDNEPPVVLTEPIREVTRRIGDPKDSQPPVQPISKEISPEEAAREMDQQIIARPQTMDREKKKGFMVVRKEDRQKRFNNLMPRYKGKATIDIETLVFTDTSEMTLNAGVASDDAHDQWCEKIMRELPCTAEQLPGILNAWLLWCISNGTSQKGVKDWIAYDGEGRTQTLSVEPFRPTTCTLRQMMRRYSAVAEALISYKISIGESLPMAWMNKRNLRNKDYMPCAFDFWVPNENSPPIYNEVNKQMRAAAITGGDNRTFGLDGNLGGAENTERHVVDDATPNIHRITGANIV
nr:polyprotein [Agave tequilana agavirus]